MKKILISFLSLAMLILIVSCGEDTTAGISRITYFPTFEIAGGGEDVLVEIGSGYTLPDATATEGGVEIPVEMSVSGAYTGASTFDAAKADEYAVSYTAINSDGYPGSAGMTILVYANGDWVNSIEGLYKSTIVRNGSASAQYANLTYVLVYKSGSNYVISDYIGGYYDYGRGYGHAYAAHGPTLTVTDIATSAVSINDNSFGVGAFGGVATITALSLDAATKTISFTTDWDAGYIFEVTMTQVQP